MNILVLSLIAGVAGMGTGGLLTVLFGSRTDKMIGIFLSFAGGVMVSIVFLELLPEAIGFSNIAVAVIGVVAGAAMVWFLSGVADKISEKGKEKLHESYAEFFHEGEIISRKKSMLRSGLIMLFAVGLHNVPEGLAMGAAGAHDPGLGLTIAILIALHNVPEGMAVSAPLIAGGLPKLKVFGMTLLVGAMTFTGAVAGIFIGGISELALALSFSIAGGAMLYVVFGEILPQSIVTSKDRVPTVSALVGSIVGMLFTALI
jgi:ZIP family zinc transporter